MQWYPRQVRIGGFPGESSTSIHENHNERFSIVMETHLKIDLKEPIVSKTVKMGAVRSSWKHARRVCNLLSVLVILILILVIVRLTDQLTTAGEACPAADDHADTGHQDL